MGFKKRLIIIIGVPLGIILILIVSLFFLGSDISSRANQIKQLRENLTLRLQSTESLVSLRQDFKQAQEYSPALNNLLPTRDELVGFIHDLTMIAKQNELDFSSSLGQESPQTDKGLGQISFTITSQGKFDNFVNFLKTLENSRYFIKLNTLDVTRQDDNFKALMTGQVFSF